MGDPRMAEPRESRWSFLPIAGWLPQYEPAWLRRDAVAGLTLAAYAVPVSLAYAGLAGLPPQTGLYCYLLAGPGYALLGSSRHLAVGPTSAIALLLGVTLAGLAAGDPARQAALAPLTALIVAGVFALAWLLRLSVLVRFISESILTGFKAGAALVIASTQLPKLFGVRGAGTTSLNVRVSSPGKCRTHTCSRWPWASVRPWRWCWARSSCPAGRSHWAWCCWRSRRLRWATSRGTA